MFFDLPEIRKDFSTPRWNSAGGRQRFSVNAQLLKKNRYRGYL
jgi:hypothetical protein